MSRFLAIFHLFLLLLLALLFAGAWTPARAYSVLTHEAIIDSSWDQAIRPLLLKRFPNATPEELKTAHGYAYGGCAIQDIGYYPSGSKFFSDLLHYVRTGDFIEAMLHDSADLNEYAFAIGAMAHYAADNNGHRLAVNPSVAILYPKLGRKYGPTVTYGQNPSAHLKTEFAFDVLQVAQGHYAPDAYHDYIGFEVSRSLIERAFAETYALDVDAIFVDFDLTIGTYRHDVSVLIPKATQIAWQIKKDNIQKDNPGISRDKFRYRLSKASYAQQFHGQYKSPGFGTKLMTLFIRLVPKIGPLKTLAFHTPTPETEKMFMASFGDTLREYQKLIREDSEQGGVALPNDDFDTGTVTRPGEYKMADQTYVELLDKLAKKQFVMVSPELRSVLLDYYSDPRAATVAEKNAKERTRITREVDELKAYSPEVAGPGLKASLPAGRMELNTQRQEIAGDDAVTY
jgi:hypothetical protein